jgi:predicted acylesterase/phospholipase RssA
LALEAHGIRPDLVVGSSVGAVVDAVCASGRGARALERIVSASDFCLGSGWFRRSTEGARLGLHAFVAARSQTAASRVLSRCAQRAHWARDA